MHFCKTICATIIISAILSCFGLLAFETCFAKDDTANAVREIISTTMEVEKQTQQSNANWAREKTSLAAKLDMLNAQLEQSIKQVDRLSRLKALEEKQQREFLRRKKEVERLQTGLTQFLDSVLIDFEIFIESDLTFLEWERDQRVIQLRELLIDPKQSPAEKFRRIFNALQIEAEYGSTVEVIQDTIVLEDKEVMADLLRIGRLSLFGQTIDKQKSAVFNPYENIWQLLPGSANKEISNAIAMAKLERTIELVKLPFGRIKTP